MSYENLYVRVDQGEYVDFLKIKCNDVENDAANIVKELARKIRDHNKRELEHIRSTYFSIEDSSSLSEIRALKKRISEMATDNYKNIDRVEKDKASSIKELKQKIEKTNQKKNLLFVLLAVASFALGYIIQ